MAATSKARKRSRGEIETLPSGALRVRVYAGIDPVSHKRHYLVETVPAGPRAARQAEKVRTRLLNQVDESRNPRTKATVGQLMDRYLEVLDVEETTLDTYRGYIRNHIAPLLGDLPLARLDGEVLDSFYAMLRTCRAHCRGREFVEHRTDRRARVRRPVPPARVQAACRVVDPPDPRDPVRGVQAGRPLAVDRRQPHRPGRGPLPRTPRPAAAEPRAGCPDRDGSLAGPGLGHARLARHDNRGPPRRTVRAALERPGLHRQGLVDPRIVAQRSSTMWEKDTKTHQQRRIALDEQTLALLRAYRRRRLEQAGMLGLSLAPEARVFSGSPDGSTWLKPDSVSQRYSKMCARLGWDMHLHQLRHYSATELIASGVDVRTVAGRLGHGGGGATTLARVLRVGVRGRPTRGRGPRRPHARTTRGAHC